MACNTTLGRAAQRRGESTFEGKPCKHGHGTTRNSVTFYCIVCEENRKEQKNRNDRERYQREKERSLAKFDDTKHIILRGAWQADV